MPAAPRTLTRDEARRVYDRIGARQDTQGFYENAALAVLLRHGAFGEATRVFELGCGTGRVAELLLDAHLPATASYRGIDLSPTMVGLARERLARFGARAQVALATGDPPRDEPSAAYDRFLSTYVLDLLSDDDIAAVLVEAHRMLVPGGLLCLTSLSTGCGPGSRLVARVWSAVHRWRPALVGGCRPLDLLPRLEQAAWSVRHAERTAPFGIPSEAIVAVRR
ncbi:MAG TPA: class I SAM-dependent methyltransferase [Candidatus Dormibacteraeota bacterium]|nr:class I SAM-dependent methyltransferase [Candidatus Dormibacteraeota bacterium]